MIYDNIPFTRSGENGTRRIRTPVASNTALPSRGNRGGRLIAGNEAERFA